MRLNTIKYSIAIGLDQSVGEFVAVKIVGIYLLTFQNQAAFAGGHSGCRCFFPKYEVINEVIEIGFRFVGRLCANSYQKEKIC